MDWTETETDPCWILVSTPKDPTFYSDIQPLMFI